MNPIQKYTGGMIVVTKNQLEWEKDKILKISPKLDIFHAKIKTPNILNFIRNNPVHWQPKKVEKASPYTTAYFLKSLPKYHKKSQNYASSPLNTSHCLKKLKIFGNLENRQHMFHYSSVQWGFRFTEPQLTKSIACFLQQEKHACYSFLKALFNLTKSSFKEIEDKKENFLVDIQVFAEKPIEGKRIDLVFEWGTTKDTRKVVAIECKLGHHLTQGQLPAYQCYAKERVQDINSRAYFFVIGQKLDGKSKKILNSHHNSRWKYTSWKELLMRWERHLNDLNSNDHLSMNKDFHQFRRTIWDRTTGC